MLPTKRAAKKAEAGVKLIAGLGNPGNEYTGTRHNVGFEVVRELADQAWQKKWRWRSRYTQCTVAGEKVTLIMPQTYMNRSGVSVGRVTKALGVSLDDVLVVHDELDLGLGKIRIKNGGGNAGHNGLKSITSIIGNSYTRLRLGIGHPRGQVDVTNWVLGQFSPEEHTQVQTMIHSAADAVRHWVEHGLADTQQRFNRT